MPEPCNGSTLLPQPVVSKNGRWSSNVYVAGSLPLKVELKHATVNPGFSQSVVDGLRYSDLG